MRGKEELPAELKAFENELASLVPESKRLNQGWLLFAAGLASAQEGVNVAARIWASAFGVMSVVAVTLLMILMFRPEQPVKIIERVVQVPVKTNQLPKQDPAAASMPFTKVAPQPKKDTATEKNDTTTPNQAGNTPQAHVSPYPPAHVENNGVDARIRFTVEATDKITVSGQPVEQKKKETPKEDADKEKESASPEKVRPPKADPKFPKLKPNGELLEELTKEKD